MKANIAYQIKIDYTTNSSPLRQAVCKQVQVVGRELTHVDNARRKRVLYLVQMAGVRVQCTSTGTASLVRQTATVDRVVLLRVKHDPVRPSVSQ